jgi:uncharacterized membrane protein
LEYRSIQKGIREQKGMKDMQNRTIAALIVIVVVVVAVISMGCVELKPTTKIREIDEQHNKYANKKVTVEGDVGYADMAGFLLHGDTG